jgi:hypothetical protein
LGYVATLSRRALNAAAAVDEDDMDLVGAAPWDESAI